MNLRLQGKLAVVIGSTAGIGLAIATALAEEGAAVIVNGRTEARVSAAVERIRRQKKGCRRARSRCGSGKFHGSFGVPATGSYGRQYS